MSEHKLQKKQGAYQRGVDAECIALDYLQQRGYRHITGRCKTPYGEVDLIVLKESTLIFVEVKARDTHEEGAYAVTLRQQKRILKAAQHYVAQSETIVEDCAMRFDVVTIAKGGSLSHIEHAWDASVLEPAY